MKKRGQEERDTKKKTEKEEKVREVGFDLSLRTEFALEWGEEGE